MREEQGATSYKTTGGRAYSFLKTRLAKSGLVNNAHLTIFPRGKFMDVIILGILVWWLGGENLFPHNPDEEEES